MTSALGREFYLTQENIDSILSRLNGKINRDAVILVHSATLLVPSLINMGCIPTEDNVKSPLEFSSQEVALGCRLMLLDLYGILHVMLRKNWGIHKESDINAILIAMKVLGKSPSTIVAHKVFVCSFDFPKIMGEDQFFMNEDETFTEEKLAGDILKLAFSFNRFKPSETEGQEIKGFMGTLNDLLGKFLDPPDDDT